MNSILFLTGEHMSEEVSGARFATLESEVRHITADVADIKASTKTTEDAIRSIDISVAVMAESIKHNQQLGVRVEKLEGCVNKINIKMAAYASAVTAIVFVVVNIEKIKAFFG